MSEDLREVIVPPEAAAEGLRLDTFLARALPGRSRTFYQGLIDEGLVLVEGEPRPRAYPVAAGQRITVHLPPPEDPWPKPQAIPLHILYEDDQVIVLDKPAGLVVHPAAGNPDGTLVNALLHHCRGNLSGIGGVKRPGIVHRLDRDTSGVIVVAKTDRAHHSLGRQLQQRKVHRHYIALVIGEFPEDARTVDAPIGRDPAMRLRRKVGGEAPRSAVTHLRVLARARIATLLEARLETGRTHQIRAHLAHIGFPIAGDDLYGGSTQRLIERLRGGGGGPADSALRAAIQRLERPFLHAWRLEFGHPSRGGRAIFHALLPPPLASLVTALFGIADPEAFLRSRIDVE